MFSDHLTVKETATKCKVSQATIYNWINNGTIKAEKLGGKTLILKSSIQPKPIIINE